MILLDASFISLYGKWLWGIPVLYVLWPWSFLLLGTALTCINIFSLGCCSCAMILLDASFISLYGKWLWGIPVLYVLWPWPLLLLWTALTCISISSIRCCSCAMILLDASFISLSENGWLDIPVLYILWPWPLLLLGTALTCISIFSLGCCSCAMILFDASFISLSGKWLWGIPLLYVLWHWPLLQYLLTRMLILCYDSVGCLIYLSVWEMVGWVYLFYMYCDIDLYFSIFSLGCCSCAMILLDASLISLSGKWLIGYTCFICILTLTFTVARDCPYLHQYLFIRMLLLCDDSVGRLIYLSVWEMVDEVYLFYMYCDLDLYCC